MKALPLLIIALSLLTAVEAEGAEIKGQVFITAKGAQSIKLGLIKVSLYQLKTLSDFVAERKKASTPIIEYFTPLQEEADREFKAAT
jgi:hypothetical protein